MYVSLCKSVCNYMYGYVQVYVGVYKRVCVNVYECMFGCVQVCVGVCESMCKCVLSPGTTKRSPEKLETLITSLFLSFERREKNYITTTNSSCESAKNVLK